MYPKAFAYRRPGSLEEALDVLADQGAEARLLAGGQSLIPLLKLRLAAPAMVLDINRIPSGGRIAVQGGRLTLGPLVRHADVVASPAVRAALPWVAEAARRIGDAQVRSLGTPAGALAEADPAGDWSAVALACGASVTAQRRSGQRVIAAADFFVDAYTSALEPDEMITAVHLPCPARPSGGAYVKLERRVGDFAVVGCAAALELGVDGLCAAAGLGLTGIGLRPVKPPEAEQRLLGSRLDRDVLAEVARDLARDLDPLPDARGSAEYKRRVAAAVTERALAAALQEAQRAAARVDGASGSAD